jgi:hypothetical protein
MDLAYAYVGLLLVLEALLIVASLVLHVSLIASARAPYGEYGGMLFGGAVILGVPATAFIKEGFKWKDQIKSCPKWMWTAALALGAYALFILFIQEIFSQSISLWEPPLAASAFALSFDAISACVLYSVLCSKYLDRSEMRQRTLLSVIVIAIMILTLLADRAGYLHRPA